MDIEEKLEIGKRLREFGESKFDKIKDFAEALDIVPSALQSTYFKGRSTPGGELLIKLSNMGCDLDWLLTGERKKIAFPGLQQLQPTNYKTYNIVGRICAGSGRNYYDATTIEGTVTIPDIGVPAVGLRVEGDSMAPFLNERDIILVSKQHINNEDLIAIRLKSGDQFVKKYLKKDGKIILLSLNPLYGPITVIPSEIEQLVKVVGILKLSI